MDFAPFDARHYPTVSVEEGYGQWVATYEDTVCDEMDVRLLARIEAVEWAAVERAADLACGTGRIARWLRERGVRRIDGVDCTPEMLRIARARGLYERLEEADLRSSPLPADTYDLVTEVLADEHLPALEPLYNEAARLARTGGSFVIVGYHPHFLMNGIPTHFDRGEAGPVAIRSYVHLLSDHVRAARAAGWALLELHEGLIDEAWITRKPKWRRFMNHPVSFAAVWRI